ACGNTSTASQTITLTDTTKPVISGVGGPQTIECAHTPVISQPTVSDNCDPNPSLSYADETTPGACPQAKNITRTWTARDACGNPSTASQTIKVVDTTKPVISSVGGPQTIECAQTPVFSQPTVSDNCDPNPSLSYADETTPGACPQAKSITRTWTAKDACGNPSTASQTITVTDTTPPVITCPANRTIAWTDSTSTNATGVATATDNCDLNPLITYADTETPGECANTKLITRTWTASDSCGNAVSCVQKITVGNTSPPTIRCPATATVECNSPTDPTVTGTATATSSTRAALTPGYSDRSVPGNCPNTKVITRTWTATDACGSTVSCTQTINVVDSTAPSITCPPDQTVHCNASTDPTATGSATATDNCDPNPTIDHSDVVTGVCPKTITRTRPATDCTGNHSSCTRTITLEEQPGSGGTLITDTLRCTLPNNQLRLIFSPDTKNISCYKLTASNPGQFYYNVLYPATPGARLTFHVTLPYPWVTQGARPIEVYDGVTMNTSGGQTCLVPGHKILAGSQQVALSNYAKPVMGVTTYSFDVTV